MSNLPELPEVETVCRALAQLMEGKRLNNVIVNCQKLRNAIPPMLSERLNNQQVEKIERRGKYILAHLQDYTWIMHLGMSGRITNCDKKNYTQQKHDHVLWQVDNTIFAFNDPRRFGEMNLIKKGQVYGSLKTMGPEPFEITAADFFKRLQKTSRPLKTTLLDQIIIAGLGNIYVCEALWQSGLSPLKVSNTITEKQTAQLLKNIIEVLQRAITAGGSSLRDYRQVDNSTGNFQKQFKVYNQTGKPCTTQKCSGTIAKLVQAGRSTFYCPSCQKI